MAEPTTEIIVLPETSGQEVKDKVVVREGGVVDGEASRSAEPNSSSTPTPFEPSANSPADKGASSSTTTTTTDIQPTTAPSRPSLVPLGSSHAQSSSSPAAPQPKRFSAVNINKKFLEKNTASAASASNSSSALGTKPGSTAARPTQPTSSHSRLVTTKLTGSPGISSTPAGWSRPSSVAPSPIPGNQSPSSSPLPSAQSASLTPGGSQLPHVGKVVQPQPRAAITQLTSSKDGSTGKPVWGNVRPPAALPTRPDIQTSDFPTAAEVASVSAHRKLAKTEDPKSTLKPTSNQLRSEEVDTFRGVHLDPNAHHWGEEQEDDDTFLDGVIEFGDGRQYKVDNTDTVETASDEKTAKPEPVSKDERFADDFDRSWPHPPPTREISTGSQHSTSPKSHSAHSPQDSSRVLFNERSNRLEPYAQASYRARQGSIGSKRSGFHEANGDARGPRDGSHNVHVLQKPPSEQGRARRFSNTSNGVPSPMPNGTQPGYREHRRDGAPPSPRMIRDLPPHHDSGFGNRRKSMGPPPVPVHAGHRENGRQPPTHLSPNAMPRRLSFRESQSSQPPEPPLSAGLSSSGRIPPHSPAMSHTSLSVHSPAAKTPVQLPGTDVDIDEARKGVMHTAAERAKARRQQEEADREAQKERAHRKAAEIEEKMRAVKAAEEEKARQKAAEEASRTAQELEAIAMIEEAVKGVDLLPEPPLSSATSTIPPYKPQPGRRTSSSSQLPQTTSTPTSTTASWRGRVAPQSPSEPKRVELRSRVSSTSATTFVSAAPSAVEQVASIANSSSDDLEVVDFSDMDKFVGVAKPVEVVAKSPPPPSAARPARPSASDFFEETAPAGEYGLSQARKADFGAWRKKVEVSDTPVVALEAKRAPQSPVPATEAATPPQEDVPAVPQTPVRESHRPDHSPGQSVQVPTSVSSQRTPIRSQFREAPMSALDDTMSRIKGVLSGMQTQESTPKVVLPSSTSTLLPAPKLQAVERWVPPALRSRAYDDLDNPRESFLYTIEPIAQSHQPTSPVVRLPTVSKRDPVPRNQLLAFKRFPFDRSLIILSFDPPVPGLSWRTLSLNDVLFRGSSGHVKGKFKYTVHLPGRRHSRSRGPLPSSKVNGGFGRPTAADGASSWRKATAPAKSDTIKESPLETELHTQSRSPPPLITPPQAAVISVPKSSETSPSKSDAGSAIRRRSQPRMPEGSSVAFIRDSKIDVVTGSPTLLVNFIVGSELEESVLPSGPVMSEPGVTTTSRVVHSPLVPKPELKPDTGKSSVNGLTPLAAEQYGPSVLSKADDPVTSEPTANHGPITPPSHVPGPWTKSPSNMPTRDAPSRAPDPEHLKAVWSQTTMKADVNAANSLQAIADDLTPLPFVISQGKPTEGATPPLTSAPSRMSLHDVTKAFQQVPTSSSSPAHPPSREKVPISPPTTNAPVARPNPTTPSYTYAPAPQNMRHAYGPYPSPMMTHSPAPVMYPHPMTASPVPSRMPVNGQQPMYNQPMWVPAPAPGNVLRPPYHPQMMSYAGYAPQPSQPHPSMMPPLTPPTQPAGRGRAMPLMSPVMSPAHAHSYAPNPALMHTPQNHGYMPVQANRGQPTRPDNGHMQPPRPHAATAGFNPGPW